MTTQADIPWFAGVLDARAHMRLENRRGVPTPRLRVTTNRLVLLRTLCEMTGVRLHQRGDLDYKRRVCSEHCHDKHAHVTSAEAYWNADCTRATIILHSCLPYLRSSRDDALTLLDAGYPTYQPTKNGTAGAMQRLGWKLPSKAARRVA